jgi:transposase-like protein
MKRFDGAGVTAQEFCEREGLSRNSFRRWRSRLGPTPRAWPASSAASTAAGTTVATAPFVDLGELGASAGSAHGALDLRIELGDGISLHLVRR